MDIINKPGLGEEIRVRMLKQNISPSELADKINCTRSNIYNIFERNSLDIFLLWKISKVLKYNFLKDFYEDIEDHIGNETTLGFKTNGSFFSKKPFSEQYSIDVEIDRYYQLLLEL